MITLHVCNFENKSNLKFLENHYGFQLLQLKLVLVLLLVYKYQVILKSEHLRFRQMIIRMFRDTFRFLLHQFIFTRKKQKLVKWKALALKCFDLTLFMSYLRRISFEDTEHRTRTQDYINV